MGKFTDISRGPELAKAYDAYQAWLKKTRAQKQAAYRAVAKPKASRVRPERVDAYVLPFNSNVAGVYYMVRALSATQTGAGSDVIGTVRKLVDGARILEELPDADKNLAISIPRYRFAKVSASQRTGDGDENAKSRMTDSPYTRYTTNSASSPFGRVAGDSNYQEAVTKIRDTDEFKNFSKRPGNQITFTPEG